ncbi:hypothetical protein EV291_1319 [Rhizobium sp. BK068]|nr:hypothetical protein EV291_1319 [Rhizobium sp. BK068]
MNRTYGSNISEIVNKYRVSDAKRRPITTRDPGTVTMLESGFGTKPNSNRKFLRTTGMTSGRTSLPCRAIVRQADR